jgi:hypothetical protein
MKNTMLAFAILVVGSPLMAQDHYGHAPSRVQQSFHKDYPAEKDARWSQSNGQWHADFNDHSRQDRGEMVAHYDHNGRHLDSHIPYDPNDVPAPVVERTRTRYQGAQDVRYTRIEHPGGNSLFQVQLNLGGRTRTNYVDEHGRDRTYHDRH